ncbi:MAG: PHP domain-containing protein [Vicinamibacteria bacterium]|nr:PHP domain-containing protein [Vicinamibacteria bacterium]
MIKIELHAHTSDDPGDRVPHDTRALLDHAARFGYGALAVTLHNRWFDPVPFLEHAAALGIVLLSGIEKTIDGKHVLLINVPREAGDVRSFDDVRALKHDVPGTLVVAPHPFYPISSALGARLDDLVDLVDALEVNAMYTRGLDYNRRARAWAAAHNKPLVGNTDLHRLDQIGMTWSEVDAPADADAICAAIRAGRVVVRSRPLSWSRALWTMARMEIGGLGRGHVR